MLKKTEGNGERRTVETNIADRASVPTRSIRIKLPEATMLWISGTAQWDGNGHMVPGDVQGQTRETFRNISARLEAEGATWDNVVRTTCHLRDLSRDYEHFNQTRTRFYSEIGLDVHPANTGIQGQIYPQDLLIEIEAMALLPHRACEM